MRAHDGKVPLKELIGAVETLLAAGPLGLADIARALGYSEGAVRSRLQQLELEQRAHRRRLQIQGWAGVCYLWHAGAAADASPLLAGVLIRPGQTPEELAITPYQSTVRTYPAINRRDPLVAALFGPAHQAAA